MTIQDAIDMVQIAMAAYPYTKPKSIEDLVQLWAVEFKDYSREDVSDALHDHISKEKFFPSPSEILERIPMVQSKRKAVDSGMVPVRVGDKMWMAQDIMSMELTPEEEQKIQNIIEMLFGEEIANM